MHNDYELHSLTVRDTKDTMMMMNSKKNRDIELVWMCL